GPSTQEVDFDEVGRAPEQLAALGEVLLAVFTRPLVRRAQELDRSHQLATLAIPDFQERHLLDVLLRWQVVDVNMLLELDDVLWCDLRGQETAKRRQELRVEVEPVGRLLEIRVHARKR